jgi:REP element-mobilizing transposase RayT
MDIPLAYHITFGSYGTRLHGDERGTIDRTMNKPGDPIVGRNEEWARMERALLKYPPVILSHEQRLAIELIVPDVCDRGGWVFSNVAARGDHVHVLLSTNRAPKAVRKWLKRWLGEELNERWTINEGKRWWVTGGSIKWVWKDWYLRNVYEYIEAQRTTPLSTDRVSPLRG